MVIFREPVLRKRLHTSCAVIWTLASAAARAQTTSAPATAHSTAPGARAHILWSVALKAPSFGSAAADDIDGDGKPEIVFGTYYNDEHVYALNGEDGSLAWTFKSEGGPIDTSVLIADVNGDRRPEVIFGDSQTGTLFCLDGAGQVVWKFKGQSGTDSPAAAADLDGDGKVEVVYGTMNARGGDGHVNVLDGRSGALLWTARVPGHVQSEPALVDLNGDRTLDVIVTNWMGDQKVRALDGKDGRELWAFPVGDSIYHGVSIVRRAGGPGVIVADRRGTVWLLAGRDGSAVWTCKLEGEREGSVFAPTTLVETRRTVPERALETLPRPLPEKEGGEGGQRAIAVFGLHVHLIDADGKLRWRRETPNAYRSIARGAAAADLDGDGCDELVFGQGRTLRVIRGDTGADVLSVDLKLRDDPFEDHDHAPLILDLDGDGALDVFTVHGRGVSDSEHGKQRDNYGQATAIHTGIRGGNAKAAWRTFRGGGRRLGAAE